MQFREDSRTQHLITGLVEEVTKGINKYEDEIEHLGGEDGCNTLKEWEDAITHHEMIQLGVHYLDIMTHIPDFELYWLNLDSIVQVHCVRESFDLLQRVPLTMKAKHQC